MIFFLSPLKDLKHSSGSVKFESRTSDSLVSRGLIDSIVNRNHQKEEISRIIDLLNNRHKLVYENKNENVNENTVLNYAKEAIDLYNKTKRINYQIENNQFTTKDKHSAECSIQ